MANKSENPFSDYFNKSLKDKKFISRRSFLNNVYSKIISPYYPVDMKNSQSLITPDNKNKNLKDIIIIKNSSLPENSEKHNDPIIDNCAQTIIDKSFNPDSLIKEVTRPDRRVQQEADDVVAEYVDREIKRAEVCACIDCRSNVYRVKKWYQDPQLKPND